MHYHAESTTPEVTYLKNYKVPAYLIETVHLTFELGEDVTTVKAHSRIHKNPASHETLSELTLQGENLELKQVKLNGEVLPSTRYTQNEECLTLHEVPKQFELEITTHIKPQENTELSGLYRSNNVFCTQCEAEGFRRITYFLDRPDVMAKYTTTIIADKTLYPVLLSNGNCIEKRDVDNNRHIATWEDPFKKPSYLFALVAGDLDHIEGDFVTKSGRKVTIQVYVDKDQSDKAHHALECAKKVMRWDEQAYEREYDLDIFMIVAIGDFNMGAMENKGLNIFNAKYILAKPETATDNDYLYILLVVGHEYLHNWSGNRVTCRDWFQLSLKEGLTVFREQEFTADMTSPISERINTVKALQNSQFTEDSSPLAHPVQPDSYIEINNFYTSTIYNKGAEVIRMMKELVGKETFRKALIHYFTVNDGKAVTIEELVNAIETTSGKDLQQFRLWYKQAGTPELNVNSVYNSEQKTLTLTVKQTCPPTPGQPVKKPFHIPLTMSLIDANGEDIALQLDSEASAKKAEKVLELHNDIETFTFINIDKKPAVSLLRHFSAPVKLKYECSDEELEFLSMHDTDGFNRWKATQTVATRILLRLLKQYETENSLQIDNKLISLFKNNLEADIKDKFFQCDLLTLPDETYLGEMMDVIDVDGIHQIRQFVRKTLAMELQSNFMSCYETHHLVEPYKFDLQKGGFRRLKNICLHYLMLLNTKEIRELCMAQFKRADNMTDQASAVMAFANTDCSEREAVINEFYEQWKNDPLVIEKWLAIQASSELPNTLEHVKKLLSHSAFSYKNPNKIRSLIGAFCNSNIVQFHQISGAGYEFLADQVIIIDKLNPQIAARLINPLINWRKYDSARQQLMRNQIERVLKQDKLSKDVYEIASKGLA